jgi:hypothetical protein
LTNGTKLVLTNPVYNRFNYQQPAHYYRNYTPKQQPQQQKSYSMRRNYYSATESCGEDTDIDDNVFVRDYKNNNQSKQSYASITLRAPLKDVNYYSDTEILQTPRSYNYNKSRQQQQQQQYKPTAQQQQNFHATHVGRYSDRNSFAKPFTPTVNTASVHNNNNNNNKQSYSLLNRQTRPKNHSTDNPYSPSSNNNGSYFKVPNIYDKLNLTQQPQPLSFNNNNNNNYQLPHNETQYNNNNNYIDIENTKRSEQGRLFL